MENQTKNYEIGFLTLNEENAAEIIKILTAHKASIFDEGKAKKIKLGYPIKKENAVFFSYARFLMEAHSIKPLSDKLQLDQRVLRFIIVNLPKEALRVEKSERPRRTGNKPEAAKEVEIVSKPAPTEDFATNELLEKKLEEILK